MPHARPQPATELEAFCATCPDAKEVTELLTQLGFRLEFQMEEQRDHSGQLPPLPAQYHYKDVAHGTEVIYLAGRDFPMHDDGCAMPAHASRFWLYPGADVQAYHLTKSTVALSYQFTWRIPSEDAPHEEVA